MNNHPLSLLKLDNKDYEFPKHLVLLNRKLLEASLTSKKIIVSIPPRFGKSELISKYFPAWYLCNFPNNRFMLITASNKFSENFGRKIRDLIRYYGSYFKANPILNDSSQSSSEFAFQNYKGEFYGIGVGSENIIGKGGNIIVIDDPISDVSKIINVRQRDKVFEWFQSDVFNRLEPNASIILVMQRWHVDDIAGRLVQSNTGWEYISIPAIAMENDVLGREVGESLWSSRFDVKALNEIKEQTGDYWFQAKYQQQPSVKTDALFPDYYFKFSEKPETFSYVIVSYDTAFKDNESSDFTGFVVLGIYDGIMYILDSGQKKLKYPQLKLFVNSMNEKYKPSYNLIEDKASGQSLIQELRVESKVPIKAIQVKDSKLVRANSITGLFETNKVLFVGEHTELINQLKQFPYANHDDMVDAFTQALSHSKKLLSPTFAF